MIREQSPGTPAADSSPVPTICARRLSCGHGRVPVLQELSVSADAGKLVCVIGPNGIGKSTLVHTLAGLLPALSGSVAVLGRSLAEWSAVERARNISIVLTGVPSVSYLSVRRFVEIGRHPYTGTLGTLTEEDRAAVDSALAQVGIERLAQRYVGEISDGERQRAAIARAFAQSASVMILDEPTAFLDVESRALVMTTLRRLSHGSGRSVIATSHDIDLVLRIADEVWMIKPDGTVACGAPEDLVLAGVLEEVFPHHVMEFDMECGSFRLPRPSGPEIVVSGDELAVTWTSRALERIGMRPRILGRQTPGRTAARRITALAGPPRRWILEAPGGPLTLHSIATLVRILQQTQA